jgi:hypothetical protein
VPVNPDKHNTPKLSRLVIDSQFRIWLPDFKNLEICLTPLPKTLYIFILKHPEGVRFKELPPYRKELLSIYSKTGNRLNLDQMKKSINDLTDIRSNSIHEKCSRIKEAFFAKLKPAIAAHYVINGTRNEHKKIILPQTLIILSDNI